VNLAGIRYGADIAAAAAAHHLDPALLAAVAAQETGGPGAESGNNVVGDGGHGRGLFQIDDRSWAFARTPAAMDPAKNADMAATILQSNLQRYGGNVTQALSAYNAGSPNAAGTLTTWNDGQTLGYADSVMRHYDAITADQQNQVVADNRETASSVNALANFGASQAAAAPASTSPSTSSAAAAASASAMAAAQPLPPIPQAQPIPTGAEAQAATSVGAQADHDEADLVDQGDVYDSSSDGDA